MIPSKTIRICMAYESGVGTGFQYGKDRYTNPYPPESDEAEAWDYGVDCGVEQLNAICEPNGTN